MLAQNARAILILEDEPLIAMDLEAVISEAGLGSPVILTSCSEGMDWLAICTPMVAILDVKLKDGLCVNVAKNLVERDIPFIVCSGASKEDVDPVFDRGSWIPKPCEPVTLLAAVRERLPL